MFQLPPRPQSAQAPVQQHIQPQQSHPVSSGPPPPPYSVHGGGPPMPQPIGFDQMGRCLMCSLKYHQLLVTS